MKLNSYSDFPFEPADNHSRRKRSAIYGVGTNDAQYKVSFRVKGKQVFCPIYVMWQNMLRKCYSLKDKSYKVCDEWKSFNTFYLWVMKHDESEWFNNILATKYKTYSPSTCYFKKGNKKSDKTQINRLKKQLQELVDEINEIKQKDPLSLSSYFLFQSLPFIRNALRELNNG